MMRPEKRHGDPNEPKDPNSFALRNRISSYFGSIVNSIDQLFTVKKIEIPSAANRFAEPPELDSTGFDVAAYEFRLERDQFYEDELDDVDWRGASDSGHEWL